MKTSLQKAFISSEKGMLRFPINPASLTYGRSASFSEITSPGANYPIVVYNKGDITDFSVEMFIVDFGGTQISEAENFIKRCMPPETRNSATVYLPIVCTFAMGTFIRRCVITSYNIVINRYKPNTFTPVEAVFTLNFKVVVGGSQNAIR